MTVIVVIGAGSIGQAIARRIGPGKHVLLADLRQEREQIEEAIITLERLARGRSKRRGRPPAWMAAIKRRGRPPGSKNKLRESAAA